MISGNNNELVMNQGHCGIAVNANNIVCPENFGFTDGSVNCMIEPGGLDVALSDPEIVRATSV